MPVDRSNSYPQLKRQRGLSRIWILLNLFEKNKIPICINQGCVR